MLAVVFMWKATAIVTLSFLQRTIKLKCISKKLSLHFIKCWKTDRNLRTILLFYFQESQANNIKVLATFCENVNIVYLES